MSFYCNSFLLEKANTAIFYFSLVPHKNSVFDKSSIYDCYVAV